MRKSVFQYPMEPLLFIWDERRASMCNSIYVMCYNFLLNAFDKCLFGFIGPNPISGLFLCEVRPMRILEL